MRYKYKPTKFILPTSHNDKAKADRAVIFISNLKHTKGKLAEKTFELLPWQEQIIKENFEIVKPNEKRQFLSSYVEISQKQWQKRESKLAAVLHFICFTYTVKPRQRFTEQRRTDSKPQSFLM